MPELPDLLYIEKYLCLHVLGKRIKSVSVKQPIVIRVLTPVSFTSALIDKIFKQVRIHGPFLHFTMSDNFDLIMNFMLTGRIQHQQPQDKPGGYLCFTLRLDDGSCLNYLDDQKMGKVYLTRAEN